MEPGRLLAAGAFAVPAPWPTAGSALAFLELLLGPTNTPRSGHLLFGILDPTDDLVPVQRRDVHPGIECCGIVDEGFVGLAAWMWRISRNDQEVLVVGQRLPVLPVLPDHT